MAVNKVIFGGETVIDLTNDTVTPETLAKGVTAHDKSGAAITGTMQSGEDLNSVLTEQETLIATLQQTLQGKASGGGGGLTIAKAIGKTSTNTGTIQFTGLIGEPKMFSCCPTKRIQVTTSSYYVANVQYDGTVLRGIYPNSQYINFTESLFTMSYSDGTLTISSGGNGNSAVVLSMY